MIENDKIGKYIKDLRTKNKLTQEELADKIYVSRQAVSNWERGLDAPSVDNVKNICILFNVSMADIYAGEKVKDIKTLNDIIHGLITMEMKRSKKIMLVSCITIVILIIMFLIYYFFTYYNNITAYLIKGDSINYDINGIMNKSVDNLYFNLQVDQNVDKICLVYKENELYCRSDANYIIFTEYNGYNEIIPLNNKEYNNYILDLALIIENNNSREIIKLDIEKDYQNSNLIKESNPEINKDDNYKFELSNVPERIKKEFKYNEGDSNYSKIINDSDKYVELFYFFKFNTFSVNEKNNQTYKTWDYLCENNKLTKYEEIDLKTNKTIYEITNVDPNENKINKIIYDYFKENYIDKYLN